MNLRRHLIEAGTLVAAAALCALVSNALAGRERKLAVVGSYPNALQPPRKEAGPALASPSAPAVPAAAVHPGPEAPAEPSPKARAARVAEPRSSARSASATPAPKPTAPAMQVQAPTPPPPAPLRSRFPAHPDKPYAEISGDDAAWLHARGVPFLDARRTKVYEEGHVALARPFSVWEADVDQKVLELVGEGRDPLEPLVAYCSGGDCEDSHMLAQKLWGAGFNNALVYRDGWPDWQKRGGAARVGPEP
jgi:rhodanese-related sulfurtransferase